MVEFLSTLLKDEDDAELWTVAIDTILSDVEKVPGMRIEIGRCSHWMRPHQSRWTTAGGEFALPEGYGRGGCAPWNDPLPQFDWSILLQWTGETWTKAENRSVKNAVRITIPSRTKRHPQAAVHTQWMMGKENLRRFYGFRKKDGAWSCVAVAPPVAPE